MGLLKWQHYITSNDWLTEWLPYTSKTIKTVRIKLGELSIKNVLFLGFCCLFGRFMWTCHRILSLMNTNQKTEVDQPDTSQGRLWFIIFGREEECMKWICNSILGNDTRRSTTYKVNLCQSNHDLQWRRHNRLSSKTRSID